MKSVKLFEANEENRKIYSIILKNKFDLEIIIDKEDFKNINAKTNLIVLGFNTFDKRACEILIAISSLNTTSKIPILLLLGFVEMGINFPTLNNPFNVIYKPFTASNLLNAISMIQENDVC
ncbi:hypothetical protein [Chitinophaga sp. 212800010-3]|uniref:hypothetical protein n=1 Tax=unclassified Chitinophaga TaxID=2619133 RepID=UPI002DE5C165|nr:hypothetical protein [Chitinophaga sp. 212800010-3]